MADKPVLMVIGESDRAASRYQYLAPEIHLVFADSADDVIELTSDNEPIDVILVCADGLGDKAHETCHWLKRDDEVKNLPIIVLDENEYRADEWLSAGAIDCVVSSMNPALLLARMKAYFELKHRTDLLAEIASLDALTLLANNRRMDEYMDIEWRRSLREFYPLSLIRIDLDGFSAFNERYGIGSGDDVLKRVARALEGTVKRAADMVSRYGRDEFVVLLPSLELESALIIAERMVEAVRELAIAHEVVEGGFLTISAGTATIEPSRDKRYQDLLDEADEMLARAQQLGGNRAQGIEV